MIDTKEHAPAHPGGWRDGSVVARTAEPQLANPSAFLRLLRYDLTRSHNLALELGRRDLRVQFQNPLLAVVVLLLPPAAMAAGGIGFEAAGVLAVNNVTIPYPLFAFTGVILWLTFLDAMNAPLHALVIDAALLARTNAPLEAVLLGRLLPLAANLALRLLLLVVAYAWFGVGLHWQGVFGVVALGAFGFSVGMMLAPLNIVYRDVAKVLMVVTLFWLFVSPVYFSVPAEGVIAEVMKWNPVTPLLAGTRSLFLTGTLDLFAPWFIGVAGGALLLVGLAWLFVRITLPIVIELADD